MGFRVRAFFVVNALVLCCLQVVLIVVALRVLYVQPLKHEHSAVLHLGSLASQAAVFRGGATSATPTPPPEDPENPRTCHTHAQVATDLLVRMRPALSQMLALTVPKFAAAMARIERALLVADAVLPGKGEGTYQ